MIKKKLKIAIAITWAAVALITAHSQVSIIVLQGSNIVDYHVLNTNFAALNTGLYYLAIGKVTNSPATNGPWARQSNEWIQIQADTWPIVSNAVTTAANSWPAVSGAVTAAASSWPTVSNAVTAAANSWPTVSNAVTAAASSFGNVTSTLSGPGLMPVGTIMMWPTSAQPAGWAMCNGDSCSTNSFPKLFAVIGYSCGGSGANFNLPDLRGRTVVGYGTGPGLTPRGILSTGGVENVTLTVDQMPSHSHSILAREILRFDPTETGWSATAAGHDYMAGCYGYQPGSTGGGGAHGNMSPFLVVNFIIKY